MENDKEKTLYPGFVKGYVSDANTGHILPGL